jgi:hypothetical protein
MELRWAGEIESAPLLSGSRKGYQDMMDYPCKERPPGKHT